MNSMSDTKSAETRPTPTLPDTNPEENNSVASSTQSNKGGKGLGITALLVGLGALSLSGYQFWQHTLDTSSASIEALTKRIDQGDDQTNALGKEQQVISELQQQQSAQLKVQFDNALQPLQQQQQALTQSLKKVYNELDRTLDSWALEEVEQLLRISTHSLQLSSDVSIALAGLKLADQRLQKLGNPELLLIRKHLANEISALSAVATADIPGLALRLNNLNAVIDNLPLNNEPISTIGSEKAQAKQPDQETQSQWRSASKEIWNDLKKLVRVQNITAPVKPLLVPEQRYFLYENLRLMINGSQTALLQKNQVIYLANLSRAQQWLNEYFDLSDSRVKTVLSDLETLTNVELNPELPTINQSLIALRAIKDKATK